MLGAILMAGALIASPVEFRDKAVIDDADIRLGAVADLGNLPVELRTRAEQLVLYPMSDARGATIINHAQLASRARALLPALSPWLSGRFEGTIQIGPSPSPAPRFIMSCGEVVPKGAFVTAAIDAGWFRVERKVQALQRGAPGSAFFARTSDGEVAKVYCEESE